MKNVKLILELDLGEFGDEEDGYEPSSDPDDWYEYYYQSDLVNLYENIKIKKVLIEEI